MNICEVLIIVSFIMILMSILPCYEIKVFKGGAKLCQEYMLLAQL